MHTTESRARFSTDRMSASHPALSTPGKVAQEDRVLQSLSVPFHHLDHLAKPLGIGYVVGNQVPAARHSYLVTIGVYVSSSPSITAAMMRTCTSSTRR